MPKDKNCEWKYELRAVKFCPKCGKSKIVKTWVDEWDLLKDNPDLALEFVRGSRP